MNVSDLRGILQYIPRFRDRTFVLSIDGEVVASENFSNILLDLAVLRSLNIKVVLVHGAGYQIRQLATERGIKLSSSDGTGITDAETMQVCLDAATRLTSYIMQGLTSVDLRAAHANSVIAHPAGILKGVDQLFTGRVERIDTACLEVFLREGIIPVIPPLGYDGEGGTFRVNSDTIAIEVGEALRAAKVIFLSADNQLERDGELVQQLSVEQAEQLLISDENIASPSQRSKLAAAAQACRQGVPRVHLLDGRMDEALLGELFSNEGVGTMVHSNEYQQIRPILKKDVRHVMALIRQSVKQEELVRRTRNDILSKLGSFWVLEVDRNIVGCVSLVSYDAYNCAEMACLYVSKSHENEGHGQRLMAFVEKIARERGFRSLLALSTQAYAYLKTKGGFIEADPSLLPPERLARYEADGRNSRILVKNL